MPHHLASIFVGRPPSRLLRLLVRSNGYPALPRLAFASQGSVLPPTKPSLSAGPLMISAVKPVNLVLNQYGDPQTTFGARQGSMQPIKMNSFCVPLTWGMSEMEAANVEKPFPWLAKVGCTMNCRKKTNHGNSVVSILKVSVYQFLAWKRKILRFR